MNDDPPQDEDGAAAPSPAKKPRTTEETRPSPPPKPQTTTKKNSTKEKKKRPWPCPCNWPQCQALYCRLPSKDLWKGHHKVEVTVGSKLYESITRNLGISSIQLTTLLQQQQQQQENNHNDEEEVDPPEDNDNAQTDKNATATMELIGETNANDTSGHHEEEEENDDDDDEEGEMAMVRHPHHPTDDGVDDAFPADELLLPAPPLEMGDVAAAPAVVGTDASPVVAPETTTHDTTTMTAESPRASSSDTRQVTFTICKHHWTRALNKELESKRRHWTSTLDLKEAVKLLYTVSESECADSVSLEGLTAHEAARRVALGETAAKAAHEKQFVRAPNNPAHAVERFLCQVEAQRKGLTKTETQPLLNRNMWIDDLLKQNKKLQAQLRRERDKLAEVKKESRQNKRKLDKMEQIQGNNPDGQLIPLARAAELLHLAGGLSRFTLMSDAWHAANPTGANQLLGYKSWDEAKEKLAMRFPDLNLNEVPTVSLTRKGKWDFSNTSELEKCLAIKLMDRTGLTNERAACIFGRDRRSIIRWRQEWGDRWGLPKQDGIAQSQSRKHMNLIPKDPPLFSKIQASAPKEPPSPSPPPPPPPLPPHFLMNNGYGT